ncbi:hypothetical protein FISHEDRAFT_66988 [Fistulina hepatica ATCC 64428]|uniref:WAC domain-containing protein n=1 Tax=Fistulina hepatica ATCC 64428 TaxID=1128425 RepID=A0A0D7A3X5_9AGAR|nr:hypothetical protein FISHEDRAFT_66988 [Fistulina hepatica ATCC 64428]
MPTCRRKKVVLTQPSETLLATFKTNPERHVFLLEQTGEIFETYEEYAARMSFYRLKQFQCEVTGKSGLDYFQAIQSERHEALTMHNRFSEPLKGPVLQAVQWQVVGRLDHLVDAVYERFKDRYFKDEKIVVDLSGTKYIAKIDRVYPPKYSNDQAARDQSISSPEDGKPHAIGGDLSIDIKVANTRDDPYLYFYWVYLIEPERDSHAKGKAKALKQEDMAGSIMEVQCGMMSRDRLMFSKSILRRFIRDCVDRDPAVASPWTVKPAIARHYGVASVMPEATRQGVQDIKRGEMDKRRKVDPEKVKRKGEEGESPPAKRQRKMTPAQEAKAKREREAREAAEKAKAEAERLAAEKKKKKPVRYPTEDLDVMIAEKDKRAGMRKQRPVGSRENVPFNDTPGAAEAFLHAWNFLVVYSTPLHLSVCTLDDLEQALRHTDVEEPCALLAEVHTALIYNLRTVPFARHSALLSLLRLKESGRESDEDAVYGLGIDDLTTVMAEVGSNWERARLRSQDMREGWEEIMVGCLKDHATVETFPRLREVLTKLLFKPTEYDEDGNVTELHWAKPAEQYYALSPEDRIAILSFMCDVAISSKAIHAHMELCLEQLTTLRKEKVEVNRQKKLFVEDINALNAETNGDTPQSNGEGEAMDVNSESFATHAKQREAARAKQAFAKQALAEKRRLEEEVAKLDRRLEQIEREFRRLLGSVRAKPLGRDRFYNRVWWFDGMGAASLIATGGGVQYGAARLFIQGPSEFDLDILRRREAAERDVDQRRVEEEGEEGVLKPNEWVVYSEIEEVEAYLTWLNAKGHRELALKTAINKWFPHIASGMKKRLADINGTAKVPEPARRSSRTKTGSDTVQPSYMQWANRKAINIST